MSKNKTIQLFIIMFAVITALVVLNPFDRSLIASEETHDKKVEPVQNNDKHDKDHVNNKEHSGHEDSHGEQVVNDDHKPENHDSHEINQPLADDEHQGHDHSAHTEEADHNDPEKDSHEGHGHEENAEAVHLDELSKEYIDIKTLKVQKGKLPSVVRLTGKVKLNDDKYAHIASQVSGVVQDVRKSFGDTVKTGEVMAVISSRELSDVKAAYLAAMQRYSLIESIFEREKKLWEDKISSEEDYLNSKTAFSEASINLMIAKQKLHALGFSIEELKKLPSESKNKLTRYEIVAPFAGTVVFKHVSLGEVVNDNTSIFAIADLDTVWIDLDVFPKDFSNVKKGQEVTIRAHGKEVRGRISFVSPVLNEETVTAVARVIIASKEGNLKPGMFVTGIVEGKQDQAGIVVPLESVQTLEGKKCVFVKKQDGGYSPEVVITGKESMTQIEIVQGLKAGQEVVTKGAFDLKAKIVTSTLDSHAGHGH